MVCSEGAFGAWRTPEPRQLSCGVMKHCLNIFPLSPLIEIGASALRMHLRNIQR